MRHFLILIHLLLSTYCICDSQVPDLTNFWSTLIDSVHLSMERGRYCKALTTLREIDPKRLPVADQVNYLFYKTKAFANIEEIDSLSFELTKLAKFSNKFSRSHMSNYLLLKARLFQFQNSVEAEVAYSDCIRALKTLNDPLMLRKGLVYQAHYYYQSNQLSKAREILDEVLVGFVDQDPILCHALRLSAFLNFAEARLEKSRSQFESAINWFESHNLEDHPFYALALNDYAATLINLNELDRGEKLLNKAAVVNSQCPVPTTTASLFWNEGSLYRNIGDFEKEIANYQRATEIYIELKNKDAASTLFQIGQTYLFSMRDSLALLNFTQALVYLDEYPNSHEDPLYFKILAGRAECLSYLNEWEESDSIYRLVLSKLEKDQNIDFSFYSSVLNNYASLLERNHLYDQAIKVYRKSENVDSLYFDGNHPDRVITLYNIARCYSRMENRAGAIKYYHAANKSQIDLLQNIFEVFDQDASLSYRLGPFGNFDTFFDYACSFKDPSINIDIENLNLSIKGLLLDYFGFQITSISPQKVNEWKKMAAKIDAISIGNLLSENHRNYEDSLIDTKIQLERQIMRDVSIDPGDYPIINVDSMVKRLNSHEIFVDFFNYHKIDKETNADSIYYYAMIIRPDGQELKLVAIGEEKSIKDILKRGRHYTLSPENNHDLYQKVWEPMEEWISEARTIHISPDGILNQISFSGLSCDDLGSKYIADKYKVFTYSNGRAFASSNPTQIQITRPLLMGDPTFSAPEFVGGLRSSFFSDLPHTRSEIDSIAKYMKASGIQPNVLLSEEATESRFRKFIETETVEILHLATHGFFLERDLEIRNNVTVGEHLKTLTNPMYRSGIVLSQGNESWNSDQVIDHYRDGILTAAEIILLDLKNTQLVVLSACETGLGSVRDGEGVFGLQRALKVAGVQQILVSLWKVPDQATANLMIFFYRYLLEGLLPKDALQKAQNDLRQVHPNPYYWSGFILLQ